MRKSLDAVPLGTDVLIDANVLIYGLSGQSAHCKTFLERCSREEIIGITLFETVNNATHQFMKGEAIQKKLCTSQPMKYLSTHPEQVKKLAEYWINTERLLSLNLLFLPLEIEILNLAQDERTTSGLLTNDSMIAASMKAYGITHLATADGGFDAVPQITVFAPTDVV